MNYQLTTYSVHTYMALIQLLTSKCSISSTPQQTNTL